MSKVLHFLYRHRVFVMLMAFVISWSSAVSAMQIPMQYFMSMQKLSVNTSTLHAEKTQAHVDAETTSVNVDHSSSHSVHEVQLATKHLPEHGASTMLMSDCHQQSKPSSHSDTTKAMPLAHCDLSNTTLKHKDGCQVCAQWHCQMMLVAVELTPNEWVEPRSVEFKSALVSPYAAQHLQGYWQEILRPPKA
ncbi:hypothetical protein D7V68_12410 [Acinetobacter cumulans]|nr:hypothetical protein D7V68_12410 [Acinetobacter cumulans]